MRIVALIFMGLIITDAYIVRLRGSSKSLLLFAQVVRFKPQPLNLLVKTVLGFRYWRLCQVRVVMICGRSICELLRISDSLVSVAIHFLGLNFPAFPEPGARVDGERLVLMDLRELLRKHDAVAASLPSHLH